ncbi:MAG: winged helix-turn-helix domain-containing protein [Candidatus Korobacteraceae bacterium]|jgi:DNA-binding response OmpR family regulator
MGHMPQASGIKDYIERALNKVRGPNQGSASDADEIIEVGDFRLDVTTRKARLRGEELELTWAEFDLLLFLISHPKHLVTPNTRLATNWTRNRARQTDFLNVLLSLRKKLESRDSGHCYIRTEPWVFYRFEAAPSANNRPR